MHLLQSDGETQVALRDDQMLLQRQLHLRQPPVCQGITADGAGDGRVGGRGAEQQQWRLYRHPELLDTGWGLLNCATLTFHLVIKMRGEGLTVIIH